MSVELTSTTSTVEITEAGYEITIVEQSSNVVHLSDQALNEVIIQEQPSNIITVTLLPHTVELTEDKYFISIMEGVIFDPSVINLTDLGDVVGVPVLGSILEFDGTNWAVTMADFEIRTDLDSLDSSVRYLGKAAPGAVDANSVWQIQRITISGDTIHVEWANGNNSFSHSYNAREGISFS